MKTTILYIWQIGVNIIGLPELFKIEKTESIISSKFLKPKTKVNLNISKYD